MVVEHFSTANQANWKNSVYKRRKKEDFKNLEFKFKKDIHSGKRESLWMIFVVRYTRVNGRMATEIGQWSFEQNFFFLSIFQNFYPIILIFKANNCPPQKDL